MQPMRTQLPGKIAATAAIALSLCLLCAWTSPNNQLSPEEAQEVEESSLVAEIKQWGEHVIQMKKAGQLPGIASDEHGTLSMSDAYGRRELHELQFPLDFTAGIQKNDEPDALYYYLFRKEAANADWTLLRAWKTDQAGKLLENLLTEPAPEQE